MDLQTRLAELIAATGALIKGLTGRVTAVEARPLVVVTTKAAYDALDPPDPGTVYVYPDPE